MEELNYIFESEILYKICNKCYLPNHYKLVEIKPKIINNVIMNDKESIQYIYYDIDDFDIDEHFYISDEIILNKHWIFLRDETSIRNNIYIYKTTRLDNDIINYDKIGIEAINK